MKQEIEPEDIREGDLIRYEPAERDAVWTAVEYTANGNGHRWSFSAGQHFLLERPFEPCWGMVVGDPDNAVLRGVYIPDYPGEEESWVVFDGDFGTWADSNLIKQKLEEGWVIIEKPEGVK